MDHAPFWSVIKNHLDVLISILLPVALLIVDTIVKWASGKTDFKDMGADACLAGFSLYTGTLLGTILHGKLVEPGDVVTGIVIAAVLAFLWWLCVALSYGRFGKTTVQPIVALIVGSATTYFSGLLSWAMIANGG